MKIYILSDKNGIPYSVNAFSAYNGFEQLGYETILIKSIDEIDDYNPENIVFAGIGNIQTYLKTKLGIEIKHLNFDYPEELKSYLGRNILKTSFNEVFKMASEGCEPFFIKPVNEQKLFTGILVKDFKDLPPISENIEVWQSEPVRFISEYRCYIYYNKLIGVKNYKGNPFKMIDDKIVLSAIEDFKESPVSYSVDFGVTDKGETLLIEANDSHSLGNYGLAPFQYARIISSRWAEMTNTKDYLYYEFNTGFYNF